MGAQSLDHAVLCKALSQQTGESLLLALKKQSTTLLTAQGEGQGHVAGSCEWPPGPTVVSSQQPVRNQASVLQLQGNVLCQQPE